MRKFLPLGFVVLLILAIGAAQNVAFAQSSKVPVVILFVQNASQSQEGEAVASVDGQITREFTIINGVAALVPPARIPELKKNPLVVSVDPDVEVKALDAAADKQIFADQVWPLGFTGTGVRLAILDTGIATTHPEFTGRIVACHTEVRRTTTCEDDNGHGTHVAGIAGAQGVNAAAKGVAPSVQFMSDKVLDSSGSGSLSGVIAGIGWAVTNNAKIISMSLGTSPVDGGGTLSNCDNVFPSLTTAVNNAVTAGGTVVAAAGNSGASGLGAPGCISSVIAVGAVDSTDTLAYFSSVGAAMTDHGIVAPGVDIFSTFLSGGYATLSGTSMATPMVSGTIALMLSKNLAQTPATIRNVLFSTADCVAAPCPNNNVGHGRVNALRAVNAVPSTGIFDFAVNVNPSSGSVIQGGSTTATVMVTLVSGTSQPVSLSSSVSPSTTTISTGFSPASGNPTFTSTLTIGTSTNTPAGAYTITITGNGGGLTRSTVFTLTATSAPPDFSVSASPSSLSILIGSLGTSTVTVTSINGFSSPTTLSASAIAGVTTSFNPTSVTPPSGGSATSTLTLSVGATAVPGTYTLTITGTSGSLSHSITITLTISTPED